jgi:hypothetical protein
MRYLWVIVLMLPALLPVEALRAEESSAEEDTSITTLTPEQVENYRFQVEKSQVEVTDLTIGQVAIMNQQRRAAKDLLARYLGIVRINGTKDDLAALQQLVDRDILGKTQVEEWQSIGVLFGDVLAREFSLKWVHYEDELGANRALRYRKTENYVFPVTLFSKRVKFDEEIDMYEVYSELESRIREFIAFENRPKLPNS